MTIDPSYAQISYNCCLSNAFKLKPGHNLTQNLVEMMCATGKENAEHIIRLVRVIPASHVKARCAQLLTIIDRLWKILKRVEEWREKRMVGKRMTLVLMYVLIESIELIVIHLYRFVPMVASL